MILTIFTLLIVLAGVVAYFYGAIKLAKYGFRLSTGVGIAVILFPPYTLYFAMKKLEVDGKETPTAMVVFGLVSSILVGVIFWYPLSLLLTFDLEALEKYMTPDMAPEGVVIADEDIAADLASDDPEVRAQAEERLNQAQREAQGLPTGTETTEESVETAEESAENPGESAESGTDEEGEEEAATNEEVDG